MVDMLLCLKVMTEKTLRKKRKAAVPHSVENYTIFHALFEAVRDKEKEKKQSASLLRRLKLRK
jgi:hypothetical protein